MRENLRTIYDTVKAHSDELDDIRRHNGKFLDIATNVQAEQAHLREDFHIAKKTMLPFFPAKDNKQIYAFLSDSDGR